LSLPESNFKKKIIAIILCAGEGKRIRNFIQDIPKPLIKVRNKPLLLHLISNLSKIPLINSIMIITGHLGDEIEKYVSLSGKTFNSATKKIKIVSSGEEYKKGPLYSFLSIFNNRKIIRKNIIYLLIPGDTFFNPEIFSEIYINILKNSDLLKTKSVIFYHKILGSDLQSNEDSMKQISTLRIEKKKSREFLKEIQQKQLNEIEELKEVCQILPILLLNHKLVKRMISIEKKLSVNTITEIVNFINQQKKQNVLAICVKSHKFFDIDTKQDLLNIKEEIEDNRRSDIS
jgi:NDP-sugar pyrophosphorylase family protein